MKQEEDSQKMMLDLMMVDGYGKLKEAKQ